MTRAVSIVAAAVVIMAVVAVSACGQKGPLYLRDNPPPGVKPPQPAPYEPVPYPTEPRDGPDAPNR
jgi:predicted small lipoprotein YifL